MRSARSNTVTLWPALLSWLAQAFDTRAKLNHPWGMVYKGLQNNKIPDAQYRADPMKYLSREYLVKCGLMPDPVQPVVVEQDPDLVDDIEPDLAPEYDSALDQRDEGVSPNHAWQMALDRLAREMPVVNFARVENTRPAAWDESSGELVIRVENYWDCDWLESRLQSTVERLLAGMMNRPVAVRFEQPGAAGDCHE